MRFDRGPELVQLVQSADVLLDEHAEVAREVARQAARPAGRAGHPSAEFLSDATSRLRQLETDAWLLLRQAHQLAHSTGHGVGDLDIATTTIANAREVSAALKRRAPHADWATGTTALIEAEQVDLVGWKRHLTTRNPAVALGVIGFVVAIVLAIIVL